MNKVQKSGQKREAVILLGRGGWMSLVKRSENAQPWHLILVTSMGTLLALNHPQFLGLILSISTRLMIDYTRGCELRCLQGPGW